MKEQYRTGCIVCQAGRCNFEWDRMLYFPAFCRYMKLKFARKWALFALYSCFLRKTPIIIHSCSFVWVVDLIAVMYILWLAGFFFCEYEYVCVRACVCVCVCACVCVRARCDYQYWNWICCTMSYCVWSWFCCVYLIWDWCGVCVSRSAEVNIMGVVRFVGRDRIPGQMFVPLGQIIFKFP
jgi:hypothetical protein